MSTCPPKKNAASPIKKSGTIIMQLNRAFDTREEMNAFLKMYHPEMIRVVKVWEVKVLRVEIELPEPKHK